MGKVLMALPAPWAVALRGLSCRGGGAGSRQGPRGLLLSSESGRWLACAPAVGGSWDCPSLPTESQS